MPTTAARSKRARNMAETPTSNKRQKQQQAFPVSTEDDLEDIDVTGKGLGERWQYIVKNVFLLGESKKKEQGSVNGSISYSALKLVFSASETPPHQASQKTTKTAKTTTVSEPETPVSDEDEDEELGQTTLATTPRTPAAASRPSGPSRHQKKDVTIPRGMEKWHASWSICIKPHKTSGWAAGITGILEHMFSYESVDDLVRLANELYRTKDTIAVNQATKTQADVRKIKSPVRIVAQRYKALWSAIESSTM